MCSFKGRPLCESAVFQQDRTRIDRSRNQRYGNYINDEEPEYDVVDDQEEMLNVRILPARPINEEREYAGREGNTRPMFFMSSSRLSVSF